MRIQPWFQAARPMALPMILIPLLIGQAMALAELGNFDAVMLAYAFFFGLLYQVYLLYTNDHADETVDRLNRRYWLSGGSRVLPEGKLEADDLLLGARVALFMLISFVLFLSVAEDRPGMVLATLLAILLCWAYNRAPLQWSYRGHGEVLQGIGCGLLLPLIGFYLQLGSLQAFPWSSLAPLFLIFYAGNIVTALPDSPSDRAGGKQTFPVRHGELTARRFIVGLLTIAYLWAFFLLPTTEILLALLITAPSVIILIGVVASGLLQRADADHFPDCRSFVTWISASQAWILCVWLSLLVWESIQ